MQRNLLRLCLILALLLPAACGSAPEPDTPPTPAPEASAVAADPNGTWTGDWGPSETDRNPVTLELAWDGATLTGTINPGTTPVAISNSSFDPDTGRIAMEAEDVAGRGGQMLDYTIEGTVAGNTLTGTWSNESRQGNFTLTRS